VTKNAAEEIVKESSMLKQKAMIAENYDNLTSAHETGRKIAATFVPGNLNELIMCFDMLNNLPEINAINNGMRKKSGMMVMQAEKMGHSEDVCTYVKADIGSMSKGSIAPNGKPMPPPDLLMLSYTGCFTFMKWFELLRHEYGCETAMLHVPYQGDGVVTDNMRNYVIKQLKENIIPAMERVSGVKFDIDRLRENLRRSAQAEDDFVWVLESAKNVRSPIDAYFGGVYYIGPIFTAFRGTQMAVDYYKVLRTEIEKMFYDEGAVVVASTYTKVGGVYDLGFRHDPDHPLETLADYCLGCYTNRNLSQRTDMLEKYVNEYQADGLLINSIKSCNSFSAGQLLMMREIEERTGKPGAFIETDLVDPRYFSAANVKNRLESYFQMIDQKRSAAAVA